MLNRRSFLLQAAALASPLLLPRRTLGQVLPTPPPCTDKEHRLSYHGFMHCELHPFYQTVISRWGCYCGAGECRPTLYKAVPKTPETPEGIMIMVAGDYWPVPEGKLHRDRDIPKELLAWSAHVCCSKEPPGPTIQCVWINEVVA